MPVNTFAYYFDFATTYAISEFEPRSYRGVLYPTLCDKVCQ